MTQKRPQPSDYAGYFEKYVSIVPDGEVVGVLEQGLTDFANLLRPLNEAQGDFRYAEGKWTIKEVVGHINDAERIFSYRLLRIARGDKTPLPGFEQDDYIVSANSKSRKLTDLLDEFSTIRRASISLIRSLDEVALACRGTSSQKEISALAILFVLIGHELHHRTILQRLYLPAIAAK